jgi:hypothetical protein
VIPFEVLEALRDLDAQTPTYFKREMFWGAKRSTVRTEALAILSTLEGDGTGASTLCSLLKVIED